MKKILIVNSDFSGGGIKQSLINLLYNLDGSQYSIDLLLFKDSNIAKNILKMRNVSIIKEPMLMNLYSENIKKIFQERRYFHFILSSFIKALVRVFGREVIFKVLLSFTPRSANYDTAISFTNDIWRGQKPIHYTGVNAFVLTCVEAKNKASWIHNDPYRLGLTEIIATKEYEKFNIIVNVSSSCKEKFDKIVPQFRHKSHVINNLTDFSKIYDLAGEENPYISGIVNIVTVGRLSNEQKRIDKIINCCCNLKSSGCRGFRWHLIGDGPDRKWLQKLSLDKGTSDVLEFHGQKNNAFPYIKYADVLVQTSDYEAYSMVLIEALALKTPVICTNYDSAKEIIKDGLNGIIVDIEGHQLHELLCKIVHESDYISKIKEYINANPVTNETALQKFHEIIGAN